MRSKSADRGQLELTVRDAGLNGTSGAFIKNGSAKADPFFWAIYSKLSFNFENLYRFTFFCHIA